MSRFICICICIIINLISQYDSARILGVFPTPSISHQVAFRPLTQELARRGHDVVVITTDPAFPKGQAPENLTEIDVHDLSYTLWAKHFLAASTTDGNENSLLKQVTVILNLFNIIFEEQVKTDEVQKLIKYKNETFDLLLLEACVVPTLVFSHIFKAPSIQVSSFGAFSGTFQLVGGPTHPLLYPSFWHQKLYNLTMWDKITELINHYTIESAFDKSEQSNNVMIKRVFGPDTPTLKELGNNIDMVFLNVHPIWEDNRPVPPNVVYMGGVHQNPKKELPKDLKMFLDSSKNGVIYISFGTNVLPSMLPPEKIQMLVKVFSQLPYDVLWKWDKDELPGKTENIRISKWLPQSDLLRHPKVKLFITQGGLQSTDESITAGVPMIGIPMLADQWYNVEHYARHNIGMRLDMDSLDEEKFKNAINTVIKDESYRRNVIRLRSLMNDQPQSPLERAVWWTEHVLRHGGAKHLRAPAANMSWTEYLELELVAALLITSLTICAVIIYAIYSLNRYFVPSVKLKES